MLPSLWGRLKRGCSSCCIMLRHMLAIVKCCEVNQDLFSGMLKVTWTTHGDLLYFGNRYCSPAEHSPQSHDLDDVLLLSNRG